jgi:hypothetical protein
MQQQMSYRAVKGIQRSFDPGYSEWARDAIRGEIIESTSCFNRFSATKLNLPKIMIATDLGRQSTIGVYNPPDTIRLSSHLLDYLVSEGVFGPKEGGFGLKVSEVIAHENMHRFRWLNGLQHKMSSLQGEYLYLQAEEYLAVLGSLSYIYIYGYGSYLNEVKDIAREFRRIEAPSVRNTVYSVSYNISIAKCLSKDFDPERELGIIMRSDTIDVIKDLVKIFGSADIETEINRILKSELRSLKRK